MLVVIGIIVVLMAILVPVVSRMRIAVQTANTNAMLQRISAGINNYFNDFNAYPGLIANAKFNPTTPTFPHRLVPNQTQSEDLVLALLGGGRANGSAATGYDIGFDPQAVGQGPVTINSRNVGKKNPYFAKRDEELTPAPGGKLGGDPNNKPEFVYVLDSEVPEFMDVYPEPRPILYMRCNAGIPKSRFDVDAQQRILGPQGGFDAARYGYNWDTIQMYLKTPSKGFADPKTADFGGRVPTRPSSEKELFQYFAGPSGDMPRNAGSYMLISAGPNRLFGDGDDIIYGSGGGQ
jgi:type II secretory pathway pseudopilin PulG